MRKCSKCKVEKSLKDFNKDRTDKYKGGYKTICRSCTKLYRKKYYRERGKKIHDTWRKRPSVRAKISARSMEYYVSKSNGTPPWLTETHKKEIENFYWLSKDLECITGEKYHVDHIMPIRGENICGLHVPWNLQVLPSDINIKKSNRLLTTVTP